MKIIGLLFSSFVGAFVIIALGGIAKAPFIFEILACACWGGICGLKTNKWFTSE